MLVLGGASSISLFTAQSNIVVANCVVDFSVENISAVPYKDFIAIVACLSDGSSLYLTVYPESSSIKSFKYLNVNDKRMVTVCESIVLTC